MATLNLYLSGVDYMHPDLRENYVSDLLSDLHHVYVQVIQKVYQMSNFKLLDKIS